MDKNNPEKQKVSKHAPVYLYRNKATPRKTTFRKKHKLLPCSKPGPLHLTFNPKGQIIVTLNKRSPLYSGTGITVLLVLLFIWNTSECIFYSAMPEPQRAKIWRRFLFWFLRRRKKFTRPYLELLSVLSDIDLVWTGYMNWTVSIINNSNVIN